ncbi:MAG: hypothetical protein ACKO5E_09395, partial [bacterium]
ALSESAVGLCFSPVLTAYCVRGSFRIGGQILFFPGFNRLLCARLFQTKHIQSIGRRGRFQVVESRHKAS